MSIVPRYDIIISGGGIVGFTLLNLLSKSPYLNKCKVLLLEAAHPPKNYNQALRRQNESCKSIQFSNRVSSISDSSKKIFETLGVWEGITDFAKPVKRIKVWNYNYSRKILFDDQNSLFSVVENNRLSQSLMANLLDDTQESPKIYWQSHLDDVRSLTHAKLIEISCTNVITGDNLKVCAPLLIGCDGYESKVRKLAGIRMVDQELNRTAVVGTVKLDVNMSTNVSNETAYQRFSSRKKTVAALLPLDTEYSSFVISAPKNYAQHLLDCDDGSFIDEFNKLLSDNEKPRNNILSLLHQTVNSIYDTVDTNSRFLCSTRSSLDETFDECPKISMLVEKSRASFPLKNSVALSSMIAKPTGGEAFQIALLGDSAHRVHPLAGQGLNLGIQDAKELVEQIELYARIGEKIFDESDLSILSDALTRYDIKRRLNVLPMMAGISQMPSLFEITPSSFISLFNEMNLLKSSLVKVANGC